MPNRVRIFLCADYYKHHRYMASMKQVASLIADAIDKAGKQACLFLKECNKVPRKKPRRKPETFEFKLRKASAHDSFSRKD